LGWEAAFFSEIEAFPRAVLAHHYPDTPLHGDFTTIGESDYGSIDLLVGGTPCQSFSVAGLRKGMDDDRGNLALEFLKLADRKRAQWVVWENVPGVLSSNGGRDFGSFLGGLGELGYGFAYRVLDAQNFGVAQRRRRVFVVGYLGDWRPPAAVLFERHSLQGHPAPSRKSGEDNTVFTPGSIGGYREGAGTLRAKGGDLGGGSEHLTVGPITTKSPQSVAGTQTTDSGHVVRVLGFQSNGNAGDIQCAGDPSPTLRASGVMGAFTQNQRDEVRLTDKVGALSAQPGMKQQTFVSTDQVRRLTPMECERLQGFPDTYTKIPYRKKPVDNCPDGPRYKALGNSMAVPVMGWIGKRIEAFNDL
jgi:DNA (cytosine-5)-methyltransferase 1